MNIYEKKYVHWYLHAHKKKFLFLVTMLLICLPMFALLTPYQSQKEVYVFPLTIETIIYGGLMAIFSLVMPIYNFHFMMKKGSVDTFFAMPIKRKRFFKLQYLLGILPLLVLMNGAFVLALLCERGTWEYLGEYAILMFIISCLTVCLYTMYSFLLMKCNNLWDAILICIGYTILPIFLFSALNGLIDTALSSFLVSRTANVYEICDIDLLSRLFSIPYFFAGTIADFFETMYISFFNEPKFMDEFLTAQRGIVLSFWCIVTIVLYFRARYSFVRRLAEASELKTTSWLCYPVLIVLITISLLMNDGISFQRLGSIMSVVFIFVIYLIMVFFARRRIALSKGIVILFLGLCVSVMTITFVFTSTRGFHRIQELPDIEQVEHVMFDSYINAQELLIDGKKYPALFSGELKDKKSIQDVYAIQELIVDELDKSDDFLEGNMLNISINYTLYNGDTIQRSYRFENEQLNDDVMAHIEEMLKKGYFDSQIEDPSLYTRKR